MGNVVAALFAVTVHSLSPATLVGALWNWHSFSVVASECTVSTWTVVTCENPNSRIMVCVVTSVVPLCSSSFYCSCSVWARERRRI